MEDAQWRLVDLASFARIATGDAAILAAASAAMIGGVCSKLEPIGSPNTDGDPLTERETEALADAARFVVDEFTERLEDEYAESPDEAAYYLSGVKRARRLLALIDGKSVGPPTGA